MATDVWLYDLIASVVGPLAAGKVVRSGAVMELLLDDAAGIAYRSGVGEGSAKALAAAVELGRRVVSSSLNTGPVHLRSPGAVASYLIPLYTGARTESLGVIGLSQRNTLNGIEVLATGGVTALAVEPNLVVRYAVVSCSPAVIVFHNHPSGDPVPSPDDRELAAVLQRRLKALDIELADFLIVSSRGSGYWSLNEEQAGASGTATASQR